MSDDTTERPRRAFVRINSIEIEYAGDPKQFGELVNAAFAAVLEHVRKLVEHVREDPPEQGAAGGE